MNELLARVRACRLCEDQLEPRPVLRLSPTSRVLVIGQAPGTKVHASGIPWDDASGDHLLEWLGVTREQFDDPALFGILPMAFCYPGKGQGGDAPPPPICHATWHGELTSRFEQPALTLLIGQYAQAAYLGSRRKRTLTLTVQAHAEYNEFPLPHPSWRSKIWMKKNPWFGDEVLPLLRDQVAAACQGDS
ncbi:MAG: uracil-DNA glycosylase family protein [Proteobacteria bacterium]|nr:uracil-DNA glycosylase family protein [Pseudomonadota bacterium]MCP4921152.1 uracil-DNA glycosylase family protein [Pseudomonadota bacterium]